MASGPSNHRRRRQKESEKTARRAAVKEMSVDVAAAAVLPELGGIFTIQEEQRTALNAFSVGNVFFALLLTSLS